MKGFGVVARGACVSGQRGLHAHGVGLTGAVGEGRDGGVHGVGAGVDGRHVGSEREAGGVVAVHDERDRVARLDRLDQVVGDARRKQASHVFDADRIAFHRDEFVGERGQFLRRVHGAGGVTDGALRVFAGGLHGADGGAQVAGVVERVENPKDIHAVLRGAAHECFDDVVGEAGVLNDVLPAQEHHVRRAGRGGLQLIESCERVLVEETQARVDGRAAPGFQRAKSQRIKRCGGGQHLGGRHARRRERLVAVAQHGVVKYDIFHEGVQCLRAPAEYPHASKGGSDDPGLRALE